MSKLYSSASNYVGECTSNSCSVYTFVRPALILSYAPQELATDYVQIVTGKIGEKTVDLSPYAGQVVCFYTGLSATGGIDSRTNPISLAATVGVSTNYASPLTASSPFTLGTDTLLVANYGPGTGEPVVSESQSVSLAAGWNLVSFPLKQLTVSNVDCDSRDFIFYGWNSAEQKWDKAVAGSGVVPGRGYWILLSKSCDIAYSGTSAVQTGEMSLVSGWNAVGSSDSSRQIDSVKGSCNILQAQEWNAATQNWAAANRLDPLKGYWIKVSSSCNFN